MKLVGDARMGDEIGYCRVGGGLDLWAVPRSGHRQKAAILSVDYGSVDLRLCRPGGGIRDTPSGTAHFLEHRLFEKNYGDITDRFNALGGDVNASTSYTATVYSLSCVDNFAANIELLFELAFDLHLPVGSVEREREIIGRELRLSSDDPEWVGYLRGLQSLYGAAPLGLDIAGSEESLPRIDERILALCHGVFYRPERMGLYLCGDFDLDGIAEVVEACLGRHVPPDVDFAAVERDLARPMPGPPAEVAMPIQRPYALFFYGDAAAGASGRPLIERELALEMALDIAFGPASDFYAEHYGGGLVAGDAFGAEVYAEPSFCFCAIGGYTQHGARLGAAIAETLERLPDLVEADFARSKRKAYGMLLRSCEQVEQVADLLCSAAMSGAEPGDYFAVYDDITIEAVEAALADCLQPGQMGSVQVLPKVGL